MFNRIQGGVGCVKWIAHVLHHTPTMKKWIKWRDDTSNSTSIQFYNQHWWLWCRSSHDRADQCFFRNLEIFGWLLFYQLWCDDTGDNLKDINGNQAIRHQKSPILMNHLPEAAVSGGLTGTLLESRLFHSTSVLFYTVQFQVCNITEHHSTREHYTCEFPI